MIDTDAVLRALEALADEAPSPERIRASLHSRTRRHRQRRLVLRLAAAGAVAGVTGVAAAGAWRFTRSPASEFPVLQAGPGGGWLRVPLHLRPGWLPRGYGEGSRTILVDGTQAPVVSREWQLVTRQGPVQGTTQGRTQDTTQGPVQGTTQGTQAGSKPGTRQGTQEDTRRDPANQVISLLIGWHPSLDPGLPSGQPAAVDVNGVPGALVQVGGEGSATYLSWQSPGQPHLMLSVLNDDVAGAQRELALRVARSLQPDPGVTWVGPRFGWLPPGFASAPWHLRQGFEAADWTQDVSLRGTGGEQLEISMGSSAAMRLANTFATTPVQIRGSSGWLVPETRQCFLTLPDGVEVFAELDDASGGGPSMQVLSRVIEEFDFGPWPDMSWVGGR